MNNTTKTTGQQHQDDADRLLPSVPAVPQAIESGREQLQTPKAPIDLAWRRAEADPRYRGHEERAEHEPEQRRDEDEGDGFHDAVDIERPPTRFGERCSDEAADQRMRGTRRDTEAPRQDVPNDGAEQRAEYDVMIDDLRVDGDFA